MTQLAISFDPCARKSGGNENSRAAFKRVDVESDELYVLQLIAMSPNGMTSAEIEQAWKPKNRFSGRLTSLEFQQQIYRDGKRAGCTVWRATEAGEQRAGLARKV